MSKPTTFRPLLLQCIGVLVAMALCACQSARPTQPPGYPPPYKVFGKWYQPIPDSQGFSEKGMASWYGKKFHGRKTSNGETYNMYAMTAAHKTLPLGTWLHVKNLENGKTVTVRVNDRGPFVGGRIIDLSYKAATAIDMVQNGTAKVLITATPGKPDPAAEKKVTSGQASGVFSVQTGSFSDRTNAEAFRDKLNRTYRDVHVASVGGAYKVRVGKYSSRKDAETTKTAIKQAGYPAFIVTE